jgi:hypothetical protein
MGEETMIELIYVVIFMLITWGVYACMCDVEKREVPKYFWYPIFAVCLPITAMFYLNGFYPVEGLAICVGFTALYFGLTIKDVIAGADFWYLMCIVWFFPVSPMTGHPLLAISYFIYLIVSVIAFAILYQVSTAFKITTITKRLGLGVGLEGFPMMLPITLALGLTMWFA